MILIIDFGSQTTHLIGRRIKDFGVDSLIISSGKDEYKKIIESKKVRGIILSGGPDSIYRKNALTINKEIFSYKIPILGICYGLQVIAHLLDGKVKPGKVKEFGPATLVINRSSPLFDSVSQHSRVWMSHGDEVISPPDGFSFIAQTKTIKAAAMVNEAKKIYAVQFHPEVDHTEHGSLILRNFLEKICQIKIADTSFDIERIVKNIRKEIGSKKAIAAVSGGLDSTVAASLVAKAIGDRLIPIHIENGLMRKGTVNLVEKFFREKIKIEPIILHKKEEFLAQLKSQTDPEEKRKIIGKLYIDLFEKEVRKIKGVKFLVQGTIYSDVIESSGSKHADNIKSHHNVGGLPEDLSLQLIEPIRNFYTDQVKKIARKIAIPKEIIDQQPHPGPGYAIRILGQVTEKRLKIIQQADEIVLQEMKKAKYYKKLLHSFPVLTGAKSTAVKGDCRMFGEVVALRAITSSDRMTADWAKLPYSLLQKISSRIVNEIPEISRVCFDITTKPPATMEWE